MTHYNKFGNVLTGNYSEAEADGTIKFNGTATVWNDIIIGGASLVPAGVAAPDLANFVDANTQAYTFDGGATVERLYGSFEMQHDYKEGTDISIHVHWAPTTAGAGNVFWQLYYTWQNINGVFAAPTLTSVVQATGTTAWEHRLIAFPDITGTGKLIGSVINFQLFRDPANASDTYGADASLLQVGVHYECDTSGSRQRTSK